MNAQRKRRDDDEQEPSAPVWMLTFSDLMSLLLTFFVLLASFNRLHDKRIATFVTAFSRSVATATGVLIRPVKTITDELQEQAVDPSIVLRTDSKLRTTGYHTRPAVHLPVFFVDGTLEIRGPSRYVLQRTAALFRNLPYDLQVQGYAADLYGGSLANDTDWKLAARRCENVARYLHGQGFPPERVSVAVFHDNATTGMQAQAARKSVEIVVMERRGEEL
jgi:chemotaxis protein MotB